MKLIAKGAMEIGVIVNLINMGANPEALMTDN